jgi:putative CocE/NonD family hydrolase
MSVLVTEHLFIPLGDGTRLAARLWLPHGAAQTAVPAILEYIPYRKRDGTRGRDEPMHHWFAEQGYAAIRVDMRGSGESDGLLVDEYVQQEQDDALEVIAWIAAQPWCDGNVGMMGKSWGGFNALQVAARRPKALKAIITVCSTDDRYADDIHYMGGALLNDNLWWGTIMLAYQARPADPELVGEAWRAQWLARIDAMPFFPALWLRHQRRDDYWRHGSVCEDFTAIECPVFAVGGWADAYTNAVSRLLAGLSVPRLGLIGPWAHIYPQDGAPGPAVGFLQEAKRWWDHWLRGEDRGIMAEPMLRAYLEESSPPATWRDPTPGRWVGEEQWPSPRITQQHLFLTGQGLRGTADGSGEIVFRSPQWVGAGVGEWMGTGVPGEAPADQRFDDGLSLVFDSLPLTERLEILGAPVIEIDIAADTPVAQLCARLCDVMPDGASRRVSYGVVNLTHRDSHAAPAPLEPGTFYRVRLQLNDCGQAFPPGHRLRLALSSAYWPLIWPAPAAATLRLRLGASVLRLPHRPARSEDASITFAPPERGPRAPATVVSPSRMTRRFELDLLTDTARYVTMGEGGLFGEGVIRFEEIDTLVSHDLRRELTIGGADPLSASFVLTQTYIMGREGWTIRVETTTRMSATATAFRLEGTLQAFENDVPRAGRHWMESIPRDLV